jgi:hypothetical protein
MVGESVSARAALLAQLGLLQARVRQQGKTQKAAVQEANRRRRRAAGRPEDLAWPRKDGGVDLSLQAVNDWFPKRTSSKEPSVPVDFEDLWSVVAVMLEWSRQLTDKRSGDRLRHDWNRLYRDAQRGTVLDAGVRAYLEAARKAAEQHPHPGLSGWATPRLADVYVRQRSTPLDRDGYDASHGDDSAATTNEVGLSAEAEPAESVFRKPDRMCVLIAGPGCGKSTLLGSWLAEAAGEWLGGFGTARRTGAAVPVGVNARSLVGEETQISDALATATRNLSRHGRHPELDKVRFLERPSPGAHWQLLVDGVDELPNAAERRAVLEKLANAVAEDPPLYRCVLATRPLAENELHVLDRILGARVPHYDLQPFTSGDLQTYTEKYFGTRWQPKEATHRAQQFIGALRKASLAELARTPLMSFMLCQLYLTEPDRALPEGRTAVYDAFTDLIYENNHGKQIADSHDEAIKNLVESLQSPRARQETQEAARQVHEQLPELIDYLAHQRLLGLPGPAAATLASHTTLRRPGKVRPEIWDAFVEDVLRHTGLLVHHADGLSFPHQTLLEYHAARHATRDQQARRQTLHQLFDAREPSPGWQNQEESYLGFLLDRLLTPHTDQVSEAVRACLKALAASGEERKHDFIGFLTKQVRLRTNLPAKSTAQQLIYFAVDSAVAFDRRIDAAEALVELDLEAGVRILEILASNSALYHDGRIRAATALAAVDLERGARILETLANDRASHINGRITVARALAAVVLERGARILETLASDTTVVLHYQMAAARALADVDQERGIRLLETLANDTTPGDITHWVVTKNKMAVERAARVPETLATEPILNDPTLNVLHRIAAGEALAKVDAERAVRILEALAIDSTLEIMVRMAAAEALARVDFAQGNPLVSDITLEMAGGYY